VVKAYGINVNRHNKAVCPFHNEDTASFAIYPDSNSFYCFGCGVGGSVIDFAVNYFNMEPLDAVKQLDNDFSLGLTGQEPTPEQKAQASARRAESEREKREEKILEDYEDWDCEYYAFLLASLEEIDNLIKSSKPFSQRWVFAHNRKTKLLFHQAILDGDSIFWKAQLYTEIAEATAARAGGNI
jgi:DNA primase